MLGLSSVPYSKLSEQQRAIDARVAAAKKKAALEQQNLAKVEVDFGKATTTHKRDAEKIDGRIQKFVYGARMSAKDYDLDVRGIRVASNSGGANKDIGALAIAFSQAASLKVVSFVVEGTYQDTVMLKKYIDLLRTQDVSIGSLVVKGNTFAITVDLYGI